jgi:hypothetical protein
MEFWRIDKNVPLFMSTHQSWSTSEERAFTENLLSTRFNLFVVLFSLVMAGSLNVKTQTQLLLILGIGSGICALVAAVLGRLQEKLDIILADLFADPSHPATIANNKAKPRGSRRRLIGIWIPRLCCIILFVGFILALFGYLTVPQPRL